MSTLFWVITWILTGTLTSLVILPYCVTVTNKINNENEKMSGLFVFCCYLCGPVGLILFPLVTLLLVLANSDFKIIDRLNKFWKLP